MTLLVRNVQILGGVRDFPEPMDVFVAGDKISAIGHFPNKKADDVLDGQGAYLSPGFIDVNTDSDHYLTLFDYPSQDDFLKQGVTTIFGGMCGSSLAPLLYGSLESMRKWGGSEEKVNVNWHTVAELLASIDKRPLGVNFGTLIGHSTIRRALAGDELRDLTKNELNVFAETIRRALREGAFGVSTGLGYVHGRSATQVELKMLAGVAHEFGGIYATHLRDLGSRVAESVEETIALALSSGAKTLVNHFVPLARSGQEYASALKRIDDLPTAQDFHFDIYPFDTMLLPIYTFLPVWAQNGGTAKMLANIADPWLAKRILAEMDPVRADLVTIAQAPGNDFLVGKSLKEVADIYGMRDARGVMLRLMAETRLRGIILAKVIDEDLSRSALANPRSFIASNAPSFGVIKGRKQLKTERTTSTFATFLSLAEHGLLPIRDAIKKITRDPAREFDLALRGEIKEGNFADLVCFKNGEFRFTVVNGRIAVKNGEFQNVFSGKALRHMAKR
jgi:N-acyl-D-amino-acid deacylase